MLEIWTITHISIPSCLLLWLIDSISLCVPNMGNICFTIKHSPRFFAVNYCQNWLKKTWFCLNLYPKNGLLIVKKSVQAAKLWSIWGRYLYRGVIREKDILSVHDGKVTFRYQDSDTKQWKTRTETGAKFLWLVLQHVLPTGFRRARNYGFLHPNSKKMINILLTLGKLTPQKVLEKIGLRQRPQMTCTCCGGKMQVGRTRIPIAEVFRVKMNGQALVPT